MSVYGIRESTPEERKEQQLRVFNYLKALIEAENINPETDWDGVIQLKLLRKISESDTDNSQREQLTFLLLGKDEEDE